MAVIVDSSVWIDYLLGHRIAELEEATVHGDVVLPPLVIAELLSGETTIPQRIAIGELLQDYDLHPTPLEHWMRVGDIRRRLRRRGLNVSLPDAHVAQCALDLDATLLTRDDIFLRIAKHTSLRVLR